MCAPKTLSTAIALFGAVALAAPQSARAGCGSPTTSATHLYRWDAQKLFVVALMQKDPLFGSYAIYRFIDARGRPVDTVLRQRTDEEVPPQRFEAGEDTSGESLDSQNASGLDRVYQRLRKIPAKRYRRAPVILAKTFGWKRLRRRPCRLEHLRKKKRWQLLIPKKPPVKITLPSEETPRPGSRAASNDLAYRRARCYSHDLVVLRELPRDRCTTWRDRAVNWEWLRKNPIRHIPRF